MPGEPTVREMRLVVTATDHAEAVHFYRDVLGLAERASYSSPDGQVVILEAGRATLEIADPRRLSSSIASRSAGGWRDTSGPPSRWPTPPKPSACSPIMERRPWPTPR